METNGVYVTPQGNSEDSTYFRRIFWDKGDWSICQSLRHWLKIDPEGYKSPRRFRVLYRTDHSSKSPWISLLLRKVMGPMMLRPLTAGVLLVAAILSRNLPCQSSAIQGYSFWGTQSHLSAGHHLPQSSTPGLLATSVKVWRAMPAAVCSPAVTLWVCLPVANTVSLIHFQMWIPMNSLANSHWVRKENTLGSLGSKLLKASNESWTQYADASLRPGTWQQQHA